MKGPLSGIRVIDISTGAAAPWANMFLGDLGAEVIKIEAGDGDLGRLTPGPNHKGESYHYLAFHRNKKSIYLDLGTKTGKEAFYDLVKISDVVLDGFRPGVLERLGADYDTLRENNPRIIHCSVTGFGQSGPYRDRPCWDPIVSALSGLTSLIGEPDRPPVWCQIPFVDYAAGTNAALGVVAALLHREKTGAGQRVEVAMLDTAVSLLAHFAHRYFLSGVAPKRIVGHHSSLPFGVYPTKDGYISLGTCWPRICLALGAEWLIDDPRFATREARLEQNREELQSIVKELFLKQTTEYWLDVLNAYDIPVAAVKTVDEMAVDPQVLHNEIIVNVPHPLGGEVELLRNPIRLPGCIEGEYLAPPTLGQHTEEVLTKLLGYSEERIRRFREEQEKHYEKVKARMLKIADRENQGVTEQKPKA